jgi:hypothetical protein
MRKTLYLAAGVSVAMVALTATIPADAQGGGRSTALGIPPVYKEVATNLNNPRQIAFGAHGAMYVAEAGNGSFNGTSSSGKCFIGGEGAPVCVGTSGSVTRVLHGNQHRVLKGLASIGGQADGSAAIGPSDLVVLDKKHLVLSMGLGTDPANRAGMGKTARKELARLLAFNLKTGKSTVVGDLGAHEAKANPIAKPDSDPTGVAKAGKLGYLVTDSGGNTLVRAKGGKVHGVAKFKSRKQAGTKYQSVPTDVVKGPDGAWYVSELTGAPFFEGAARIWRVVPGHRPHVWASGLTNVTGMAFDGRKLYAVQITSTGIPNFETGALVRVFSDKSGRSAQPIASDLFAPYGVTLHRGAAYVSTCSVCYQGGSVIKVPLG